MDHFDKIVEIVIDREGGPTTDHAGYTYYGITRPFFKKYGPKGVKLNNLDVVKATYRNYWDTLGFDKIIDYQEALKIFDLAVWQGERQSCLHVQRALMVVGLTVKIDGKYGTETFEGINSVQSDCFLAALRSQAEAFVRALVLKKPEHKNYLKGWLKRAVM